MPRRNGKPLKPGPKFFRSDPKLWCKLAAKPTDGKRCEARRKDGTDYCSQHQMYAENTAIESYVPGVPWEPPKSMPVRTIDDLTALCEQQIDDVRQGRLPPLTSNAIAKIMDQLTRLIIAKQRLDPTQVAARAWSREQAASLVRTMTVEQMKRIIDDKNGLLDNLDRMGEAEIAIEPLRREEKNADD